MRQLVVPHTRPGSIRWVAVGAVLVMFALGVAGCATNGDDDAGSNAGEAPAAGGGDGVGTDDAGSLSGSGRDLTDGQISQAALVATKQVVNGSVQVEVDSVPTASRQVAGIATALGGVVTDEQTDLAPPPEDDRPARASSSVLTLEVPPAAYDRAADQIADLGRLVDASRTTADVTDEYVDVQARVAAQEASLDRLLALVDSAAELDDILALENEIARRQADLDALKARIAALDADVAMATLVVTLSDDADDQTEATTGFLGGLDSGWHAFVGAVGVGLTVLGAVLPFALLAAVGYLAIRPVLRRRRRQPLSGPPPAAETS
jgi:hypothetical protein